MKNLIIISDVVFNLIAKKIYNLFETVQLLYSDSIISSLLSFDHSCDDERIILIHFDTLFHRYNREEIANIIQSINVFAEKEKGFVIISNNLLSAHPISNLKNSLGQFNTYFDLFNVELRNLTKNPNIYFYDFNKLVYSIGVKNSYNFQLGYLYQMPYTKNFIEELSDEIVNYLNFIILPEKKVIILDCDNTLWNGIVGEDGISNIKCDSNADGIIYSNFQKFLKQKKEEGFLLCLCSKNNEEDVKKVFLELDLPLQWDDFIIKKVNWDNKQTNILDIKNELNVGIDSLIFVDDNDFELNFISTKYSEIRCLKFENKFDVFIKLIDDFSFKRKLITKEDVQKTAFYEAENKRKKTELNVNSLDEYVESLDIKFEMKINDIENFDRLSQLTEKTNQFNLNKQYYSVNQLLKYIENKNLIFSLIVKDKYSDYGIVGLILTEVKNDKAVIKNYLLSCRVLGRKIEYVFFEMVTKEIKRLGIVIENVILFKTEKNIPAQNFYKSIENKYK